MLSYVVGFLFDDEGEQVVLIKKERPDWQKGRLNGIGGKIEDGETGREAMRREFEEETGVHIEDWTHYATLTGQGYYVEFYFAYNTMGVGHSRTITDEEVRAYFVVDVIQFRTPKQRQTAEQLNEYRPARYNIIPNLWWLIPMALMFQNDPQRLNITEVTSQ